MEKKYGKNNYVYWYQNYQETTMTIGIFNGQVNTENLWNKG